MSQEELARQLGYTSPATISHFESGERRISIVDLQRVAAILGPPLNYFIQDDMITEDARSVEFRAEEVRPSARPSVASFVAFVRKHGGRRIQIQPGSLATLRPSRAAEQILDSSGIKEPPVGPRDVARSLGVPVFDWDFPDEVSGMLMLEAGVCAIGVNENHPETRQRFTVAHEVGHLLYRNEEELIVDFALPEAPGTVSDERLAIEIKANQLAADLLMPRSWLKVDFDQYGENTRVLAKRYGVSEQALWFRLLNLGLVSKKREV